MKKTKILATISDIKCDVSFLQELFDNGVNAFRMNTAHQTPKDTLRAIKNIRQVSKKTPIIIDTKGPEVRTTPADEPIEVVKGDKIKFAGNSKKKTTKDLVCLNYDKFHKDIPNGAKILYNDGEIEFTVIEKKPKYLLCRVENEGEIEGKKSINVPGTQLKLPSLTAKDKLYVEFSAKNNIDFIAHSFVRNKEDLKEIQKILDKHKAKTKIISKIENQEGVDNIDEILEHCAGIMVARGDLAIEIPLEKVPAAQKLLIRKCNERRKMVITATQMLHTMIENPRPTRAEVSDIANAIYDGTDCLMLSGESAYGKYPLEAVKVMNKVAKEIEKVKPIYHGATVKTLPLEIPAFLAKSAIKASKTLPVKAIIADTMSGKTIRYLSAFKGKARIYALCYSERVMRELRLNYGVYSDKISVKDKDIALQRKVKGLIGDGVLKPTDTIILLTGNYGDMPGASDLKICLVKDLLK